MKRMVLRGAIASLVCAFALSALSTDVHACWGLFGRRNCGYSGYSAGYVPSYSYTTAGYAPVTYGYAPSYGLSYDYVGSSCTSCCPTGGCSTGGCPTGGCPTGGCPTGGCNTSYYSPSCCPTTCCATGDCATGNCPNGDCSLNNSTPPARSAAPTPIPDNNIQPEPRNEPQPRPQTFLEESAGDEPEEETTPGFRRRDPALERQEGTDAFGPSRNYGDTVPVNPGTPGGAYRVPMNDTVIEQREPAPMGTSPEDPTGEAGLDANNGPSIGPVTRHAPLNLDQKTTWRPMPQRTRVAVEATYSDLRISRTRISPVGNEQWTPAARETQVVRK